MYACLTLPTWGKDVLWLDAVMKTRVVYPYSNSLKEKKKENSGLSKLRGLEQAGHVQVTTQLSAAVISLRITL